MDGAIDHILIGEKKLFALRREALLCDKANRLNTATGTGAPHQTPWITHQLDGTPGPVTLQLRTALTDLHHGVMADLDGWLHHCS